MKIILCASLLAIAAVASADRPAPPKPPQEAVDACASSKSGDACSFAMPDREGNGTHTITGTCDTPPEQTVLACKPDHPPPPHHHRGGSGDGPPPPR